MIIEIDKSTETKYLILTLALIRIIGTIDDIDRHIYNVKKMSFPVISFSRYIVIDAITMHDNAFLLFNVMFTFYSLFNLFIKLYHTNKFLDKI
ncbi:hypothetical protein AFL46_19350 [Providencia stuartii]|nr:hypothetical protein AFL46_19350 [Providencia stuartii]